MSPHAVCVAFSSRTALIILFVAPWVVTAGPSLNQIYSTNDRAALLCIKSHLFKPNNLTRGLATWSNSSQNFCRWHGVSCSRRHANAPRVVVALDLEGEGLVGQIPPCISNLTNVARIHLPLNQLVGPMPPELGRLGKLKYINLSSNSLSGVIPAELASCSGLRIISLRNNSLDGGIPAAFFNCSSIQVIDLLMNSLYGPIPSSLGNLSSLVSLFAAGNHLTGDIPDSLARLSNMQILDLSYNNLSGTVPSAIYNLSALTYLGLGNNGFVGRLPSTMGNTLPKIEKIIMSVNKLNGEIPRSLANATNLIHIFLAQNSFSGVIPSLGTLLNLQKVVLFENRQLEAGDWTFLSSLTNCTQLSFLVLDGNNIQGNFPSSVSNLSINLEYLVLGSNHITGTIPSGIVNLISLSILYLDNNMLTGPIPDSIGKLRNMFALNLSKNKFYGNIPPSLVSLLFLFLFLFLKKGTRKDSRFLLESSTEFRILSYNDLSKATDKFSSENLIGSGQFSLVYKGSLYDQEQGQMIAVKVFKLSQPSASKSFFAECRALRNIRHRNLVKVITACSTYDPLGNEFKALVLEYMPNGSLAERLHTKSAIYGYLSLGARISIAVDVASVLEYLHIWSVPPMVHCDLKPSNILFDDDNLLRVGDFGLARFLHDFSASGWYQNSTSMIGPKGSVGYIPPEYGLGSRMSTEGDIYSYGIVLLEMLTGKHPTDELFDDGFTLHKYVEKALPEIGEILDPDLSKEIGGDHSHSCIESYKQHNKTEVQKCILQLLNLGLQCSEEAPKDRPNIQDVYSEVVAVKEHFLSCSAKET
ncbi:unnamed protein product [Urochloa decumbens]|uniref:Receptor kinase-like protein Xa21 n=1 Tax=Urochloa decumbens TaxID=240449 RepID=A0ABC8VYT1_9POAL